MYLAFLAFAFDVLTSFPFSFAFAFALCDSRKYPYPPPPLRVVNENSYGVGGLKGRNFRGVWGVPKRRIFHRVVKDTIDPTRHTCIYGLF